MSFRREFGLAFHGGAMLSSDAHGVPVPPHRRPLPPRQSVGKGKPWASWGQTWPRLGLSQAKVTQHFGEPRLPVPAIPFEELKNPYPGQETFPMSIFTHASPRFSHAPPRSQPEAYFSRRTS